MAEIKENECYDGEPCVQWHVCKPGDCAVRDQVDRMRHEEAPTQIIYSKEKISEETLNDIRRRFEKANAKAENIWIPAKPIREIQPDHNRRHICIVCCLVSWLPGHYRCGHGRIVCERCEVEAAGW